MIKAERDKINCYINGKWSARQINGYIKSGISYAVIDKIEIPLRTLGEGLGFKVGWDAKTRWFGRLKELLKIIVFQNSYIVVLNILLLA